MTTDPMLHILHKNAAAVGAGGLPNGQIPDPLKHKKRFPFLFLIDISGSTGQGGANADIHAINQSLGQIFDTLKNPPPSSPLADQVDQIDVSVVTYSDNPHIEVDWTMCNGLPVSTNFTPLQGTRTALAFEFALAHIHKRLDYYRDPNNRIPSGLPHIIHITDGAPTDMRPGDARWVAIAERLGRVMGTNNPEAKQQAEVLHFISPNGCRLHPINQHLVDETGAPMTGQQALAKLSGKKSVYEISQGVATTPDLVKLITVVMTTISAFANKTKAHDIAKDAAKGSKTIKDTDYE